MSSPYCIPVGFFGKTVRILASALCLGVLLTAAGCGGGRSSSTSTSSSPLSGNWQLNLVQNYPAPSTALSASGFLVQSDETLTGSIEGPTIISSKQVYGCSGVGTVSGTVSGQNVTFSLNPGGTVFDFTGTIASGNTSMSGTYSALGAACSDKKAITGTFTAFLIPPLNGSFTGTLTDIASSPGGYMSLLNLSSTIPVTGSFTQSSNAGTSDATVTGTINATGYPCFETAYLTGTISGQSVYLDVFSYKGDLIGTVGLPATASSAGSPAIVASTSSGTTLTGTAPQGGLALGVPSTPAADPCPPAGPLGQTYDATDVCLALGAANTACTTQQ